VIIRGRFFREPSVNRVTADERANYRSCGHCRIARTAVEATATTSSGRFAANSLASSREVFDVPSTCEQWKLEIGSSMAGSGTSSGHRHPPEFYICPGCGSLTIYSTTRDANGRPVYDCAKCHRQFDAETLERHYRERRPPD